MKQTAKVHTSRSNQSMEVFRLIASMLVVFIHVQFPGTLGSTMNCLARCAVPGFFAMSGFFCYGVSSRKIGRRIGKMVRLILIAMALEFLWGYYLVRLDGCSFVDYLRIVRPNAFTIASFVIMNMTPFRDTYWYLAAAMEAMMALWVYVRFQGDEKVDYRPFYTAGICLFACNLAMGLMGVGSGNPASVYQYRNGLFFGIPLFAMGLFLGEHWQRIIANFSLTNVKLVLLAVVSMGFSLMEWRGLGISDLMVGSVAEVCFLLLLTAKNPVISPRPGVQKLVGAIGTLSTTVYILHSIVIAFYERFLLDRFAAEPAEPWLRPLAVLAMSLCCGIVCVCAKGILQKCRIHR